MPLFQAAQNGQETASRRAQAREADSHRAQARETDSHRAQAREAGFTLLEILVVIAILSLLIGLVAPAALRQLGSARDSVAKQSIERLGGILDLYKLDTGSYPNSAQGLQALVQQPAGVAAWNGPYLKGATTPQDPWNRPYIYRSPSARAGHEYDLCSAGANPPQSDQICNP